ncbi:MAG: HNH endonuclease [Candidatus Brocadia sp.]|nr:HNH endonuclease [Candidatus Brocadia sp.]
MIKQFQKIISEKAHEEFQKWREENPEGFLLNVKSKSSGMIHRSICAHLGNTEWQAGQPGDLGKQMKVCSQNLKEIHNWATQNGITHITECSDCKPIDDQRIMSEIAETIFNKDEFDPDIVVDERRKTLHDIVLRQGQPAFRKSLLDAYGGRCAITECDVVHVLESAHIYPYQGEETNTVTNGLLLRSDIHTLFDLHIITVHPETLKIHINPTLKDSLYWELNEKTLREPIDEASRPSKLALRKHFDSSGIE